MTKPGVKRSASEAGLKASASLRLQNGVNSAYIITMTLLESLTCTGVWRECVRGAEAKVGDPGQGQEILQFQGSAKREG
jgi:hypothetical protein